MMKLYHHPVSSASFKVRAVLFELEVPCEFVTVDLMQGEHKRPEYLAKNPNGKVPLLEDEGFFVWESNAIITYLAARFPEKGLMPLEPCGLATVHQWLQWQATQYMPAVNQVMRETVYASFTGRTKDEAKWSQGIEEVRKQLTTLERSLEGLEYVTGKLSLADFSLASALHLRKPMGLELSGLPRVQQWVERLEARASVRKSLPPV